MIQLVNGTTIVTARVSTKDTVDSAGDIGILCELSTL